MKTTVQERTSFEVVDSEGNVELLHLFVELLEVVGAGGRSSVEGIRMLQTSEGLEVDRVARGKFRQRKSGRLLYCDPASPNA